MDLSINKLEVILFSSSELYCKLECVLFNKGRVGGFAAVRIAIVDRFLRNLLHEAR